MRPRFNVRYISGYDEINLSTEPYMYDASQSEIFTTALSYGVTEIAGGGGVMDYLAAKPQTLKIVVQVWGDTNAVLYAALNRLHDFIDADMQDQAQLSRLAVGRDYIEAKAISHRLKSLSVANKAEVEIELLCPRAVWLREEIAHFNIAQATQHKCGKKNPRGYSYGYTGAGGSDFYNQTKRQAIFALRFYGPCNNPSVLINGLRFGLRLSLLQDEWAEINGLNGTITRRTADGSMINCFNDRIKDVPPFSQLPPGAIHMTYPGTFEFDLRIYSLRMQPEWGCWNDV